MSTAPPRLRETDPRFAQLAGALDRRGPDPALVAKVLAIPDVAPITSAPAQTTARTTSSAARWVVAGACALTLATLGWSVAHRPSPASQVPTAPAPVDPPALQASAPETSLQPSAQPGAPTVSVDDLPSVPNAPERKPTGAVPTKTSTETATAASTFHEELVLVEAARSALARGDGRACLETLDRYDARFAGGVLASEADITRIEALAKVGRSDEASALADRFLTRHASSPYGDRVRALRAKLGAAEKGTVR